MTSQWTLCGFFFFFGWKKKRLKQDCSWRYLPITSLAKSKPQETGECKQAGAQTHLLISASTDVHKAAQEGRISHSHMDRDLTASHCKSSPVVRRDGAQSSLHHWWDHGFPRIWQTPQWLSWAPVVHLSQGEGITVSKTTDHPSLISAFPVQVSNDNNESHKGKNYTSATLKIGSPYLHFLLWILGITCFWQPEHNADTEGFTPPLLHWAFSPPTSPPTTAGSHRRQQTIFFAL